MRMTNWISGCARVAMTLAAIATCIPGARAALTYLDASKDNTGPLSAFTAGTNGQADDDLWTVRTGFSVGSTFIQSGDGNGEDSPELTTTITGLAANSPYRVYVHFWDGSGTAPDWNIRAGFTSSPGGNTLFANPTDAPDLGATPAVLASTLAYVNPPTPFTESDRTQFAGLVGIALSDGSGNLNVYIDDLPSQIGVNNRTWYDGVSYELVPEPAGAMLAMIGGAFGLVAARRRNRK